MLRFYNSTKLTRFICFYVFSGQSTQGEGSFWGGGGVALRSRCLSFCLCHSFKPTFSDVQGGFAARFRTGNLFQHRGQRLTTAAPFTQPIQLRKKYVRSLRRSRALRAGCAVPARGTRSAFSAETRVYPITPACVSAAPVSTRRAPQVPVCEHPRTAFNFSSLIILARFDVIRQSLQEIDAASAEPCGSCRDGFGFLYFLIIFFFMLNTRGFIILGCICHPRKLVPFMSHISVG